MKLIVNEKQYKWILNEMRKEFMNEMAYPSSFNFDEFRQLRSFAERVRYCEARLQRIAQGSSRIVYQVDDDKVLKLAKNQKGVAQNEVEVRLGTEPYYTCFADVYEYDENGLWVEMELCQKAKKSDFKRIYGVPFEALCCAIYDMAGSRNNYLSQYRPMVQEIWNGPEDERMEFFNSIHEYVAGEGLSLGIVSELMRPSCWGISKDGGFKLIDYGCNDDVYDKYYSKGRR